MDEQGSVTRWLFDLLDGDDRAAGQVWDRYFDRLASLAQRQMKSRSWGGVDGEDVALSALDSFLQRRAEGDYPRLRDRDELWKLLTLITRRKAINAMRHELARRRGGGRRIAEFDVSQFFDAAPTAADTAEVLDEARRLLDVVLARGEPNLRAFALGKLEGFSNDDLAARLGVSRRTIDRKLALIRQLWESDLARREDHSAE
jgi:DNA-directed RNA polymerase specialized sigma24 family protein